MGDGIGTDGAVLWLDRVEAKAYERLLAELDVPDLGQTFKLLNVLERLSII